MSGRRVLPLVVALALALASGCGSDSASDPAERGPRLPAYAVPSVAPEEARDLHERCGVDVDGRLVRFRTRGGSLEGAVAGSGTTAAVLLHQTDRTAMCGWAQYAAWLATQHVRVVLVNACGYGETRCSARLEAAPERQVAAVVDRVRRQGARRVVLVGASMGGAVALGVGQQVGADAIVDLSGPAEWPDVLSAEAAARGVRVPLLVAVDPGTDTSEEQQRAVAASPARRKEFVDDVSGHGWDLVHDQGAEVQRVNGFGLHVRDWILGQD